MCLKKSKDPIEQLYGHEILENFPNYEKFWEEFIGNPNVDKVEPYEYHYPESFPNEKKVKTERSYLKIQMAHYTLFCHMAGAHFQVKELEKSMSFKGSKKKYFRSCEHFEAAYMHIGSVFYVLETLWCTVLRLIGEKEGKGGLGKLAGFLQDAGKTDLATRLLDIDHDMMNRRHLPVHYSRIFVKWHRGQMYVPLRVKEEMLWSEGCETNEWRRSDRQAHFDLVQTEKLVNELHEVLIEEYGRFIVSNKIVVNHGAKKE